MPVISRVRALRGTPVPRARATYRTLFGAGPTARRTVAALPLLACAAAATLLSACATERLAATAPHGVDLSGQWRFNENLSDDPAKLGEENKGPPPPPGEHQPHGSRSGPTGGFGRPGSGGWSPGGPGGMSGPGGTDEITSTSAPEPAPARRDIIQVAQNATTSYGLGVRRVAETATVSSIQGPPPGSGGAGSGDGGFAHMLDAPGILTIVQAGPKLILKAKTAAGEPIYDEYTAGELSTITFGRGPAERTAGWREATFIVITKPKKGISKEDDFALDSDGHLIFTTQLAHTKKGYLEFKRVYDRIPAPRG